MGGRQEARIRGGPMTAPEQQVKGWTRSQLNLNLEGGTLREGKKVCNKRKDLREGRPQWRERQDKQIQNTSKELLTQSKGKPGRFQRWQNGG